MKTHLKNALVPLLARKSVSRLAERLSPAGLSIFMLHRFRSEEHGVRGHDPDYLHRCLAYLSREGYRFVSLETVCRAVQNRQPLPERAVAFTMDDGFLDQATIAAPVFQAHRCPVTIFLITGLLDRQLWPWDDRIGYLIHHTARTDLTLSLFGEERRFHLHDPAQRRQTIAALQNWLKTQNAGDIEQTLHRIAEHCQVDLPETIPRQYQPIDWALARDLERQGVRFAPHTHSHRILSRLDDASSRHEIESSWQRLREELHDPAPVFCYPTGRATDFGHREMATIESLGMIGAVSTEATFVTTTGRCAQADDYRYRLPRFAMPDDFTDFVQYSSWIERAKHALRG